MNMPSFFILITVALLSSSCSVGFHREWSQAERRGTLSDGIEGRWEGHWKSDVTGHTGKLRCVVSPQLSRQGDRKFAYWATWGRLMSGSFTATHHVLESPGGTHFSGTHRMPKWAGGVYTYVGTVVSGNFKATYHCAQDDGIFEMNRPAN
ncbi:MAG: hypothetical protein K1X78_26265 [Verrucomicrobiaceae bacterium]|nr:hypothetical protein [Verrucomicrobiaceae bacterium]